MKRTVRKWLSLLMAFSIVLSRELSPDFSIWSITSRRLSLRPSWSPSAIVLSLMPVALAEDGNTQDPPSTEVTPPGGTGGSGSGNQKPGDGIPPRKVPGREEKFYVPLTQPSSILHMAYFCSKLRRLTSLRGIPVTAAIFSKEFSPDFSMWSITSRRLSLRGRAVEGGK